MGSEIPCCFRVREVLPGLERGNQLGLKGPRDFRSFSLPSEPEKRMGRRDTSHGGNAVAASAAAVFPYPSLLLPSLKGCAVTKL